MTYQCKHFEIHELVPPDVYQERGEKAWQLMDDRILMALDALRDKFGPLTVNNWKWGGDRKWSGLRTEDSPYGSRYSQHRFGRAVDFISQDHTAEEIRQYILNNRDEFPGVMSMELGVSWVHIDCRNCNRIMTYTP